MVMPVGSRAEVEPIGSGSGPDAVSGTGRPGATNDGHRVPLLANAGDAAQAAAASAAGAEGIGLFRTELAFLGHREEPTVADQAEVYGAVLAAFPRGPVIFRTLDAGPDERVPFMAAPAEANPAIGVRGIRLAARRPDVLERQLEAIALAGRRLDADVSVMAPMVSTVAEAVAFADRARNAGVQRVGAIIEVPAAAILADRFAERLDFLSVGTDDLGQYALAADRGAAALAELNDPWQPALLALVARTCTAGAWRSTPVGVCGAAAADPVLAAVLVGFGATSLSMAAPALGRVSVALERVTRATCRAAADAALAAADPAGARAAATAILTRRAD